MTLEEILAYAQQQGRGQSLFQQPTSQSYFNRGLGIGPRIAGNTVVNIDQSSSPPAPLARPESPSQARDIRQAGFATALGDLAPLLSDWRTTPAAALAAAVGGYGRGAYAARKDVAATQRAERETAAAEQTRQAQTQTAQAEKIGRAHV